MYEKDTFARLYFPSNKEVEAEVKNSVRKNGSTCPLTKKPENRYLTTKDKNQMSLKPSSVEFKSNEGLKLSTLVEDSFGAKLVSHKNINLNSKGSISFHAKNMINIKAKTDVLFYRDNKLNPQSFTMENEFHYLGNNVLLEGADRSSYSMLGDDPLLVTPIKEGFFDGFLDGLGKFALGVAAGLAGVACVAVVVGTGGLALAAAGVVAMSTVGSAVMGAFVVGGISVVVSEGINRGRGVELNQEESFKMGISAAVSGAVMGAFGMANALKINIGAAVIGESATQIMDREFRPMDFGLTIGMEVIFYGIGKGIVKVKAMKAEGRSLIPKNIDVKQALKSATNKAKKEIADSLAKINSFKKAISKGIAKTQKKIADGLQNGADELSKFLPKINSQQFEFAWVGGSNNYKFECEMPKSTNPLYEGSITQFAAESTKKVVKSGKNFIDVKTTTKNAAEESTGKTNSTIVDKNQNNKDLTDNKLLSDEGKVDTFGELDKIRVKGDNLTPHHMPSDKYMSNNNVKQNDGVSIWVEQPRKGGRHRKTKTYGRNMTDAQKNSYYNLSPRNALAHDINDLRKIYKDDGLYTKKIIKALRDVIKLNKIKYPNLFSK